MWFVNFIGQELKILAKNPQDWAYSLIYILVFYSMFGISLGLKDQVILPQLAPYIIVIGYFYGIILGVEVLFRQDQQDGFLAQILLSKQPTSLLVLGKLMAFGLLFGLPLLLMVPLIGVFFNLNLSNTLVILAGLILATPSLLLLGQFAAALTIGINRAAILIAILVIPLITPIILLVLGAEYYYAQTGKYSGFHYYLLTALSLSAVIFLPHIISKVLYETNN